MLHKVLYSCFLVYFIIITIPSSENQALYKLQEENGGFEREIRNLQSEILRLKGEVVRLTEENQRKQERVAFSAFRQKGTTQVIKNVVETIIYNGVQLNIGGGYNESSGVFTVPVGGAYVFFFGIQVEPGKHMAVHFTWNGIPYKEAMAGNMTDPSTGSNMMMINAKKGDCMWIQTHPNWYTFERINIKYDPNYFSGFLLYET